MNRHEKAEIEKLPDKYRPMGAWGYFGYGILFVLPLIGFICAIVFSLDGSYIARRSYARAFIIYWILEIILCVLLVVLFTTYVFPYLEEYVFPYLEEWLEEIAPEA